MGIRVFRLFYNNDFIYEAICPEIDLEINTTNFSELWKSQEDSRAFVQVFVFPRFYQRFNVFFQLLFVVPS